MKLVPTQYRAASEIAGNIATAWFALGIISPILTQPKAVQLVLLVLGGLIMSVVFIIISLSLAKEVKND